MTSVISYKPIGIIHSPFREVRGTPIQPVGARGFVGRVELFEEYAEGFRDLGGFSHIFLIYHFHLAGVSSLSVKPFLDNKKHGIFATRAPSRPNPIGLSIVKLLKIEQKSLLVRNIDIVDRTPLLDIKPFVPQFDLASEAKIGWLEGRVGNVSSERDDGRFRI